ncbi:uncharacterized protein LOC125519371 [Triticum urartu]|uniref:uncharacterized protein LOC125519371 n=1 Tax=Triticum urartu TaxID=4572 RepID=UPI0020437F28|nr:uncharacterized protein LOC125519371 [Triticum urartu]
MDDLTEMQQMALDFYKALYTLEGVDVLEDVLQHVPSKVTVAMNESLTAPYRKEEVKKALFQMYPTKAPGSDGFPAHFFQRHWDICGVAVTRAVLSIVRGEESPECVNDTVLLELRDVTYAHLINYCIECSSQALSSNPKVPTVKRKADANAATTVPKKVQKLTKDWSCALCQVSAPCEAALNEHLGGRKHKAKLAQRGVSKTIKDGKNCSQTTTGNENSTDPCDAPKKICMLGGTKHKAKLAQCGVSKTIKDGKNCLQTTTGNENNTDPCDAPKKMKICMPVDGAMHEVVRKDKYLWCDHCRVSCDNYATMACHLRCKKQSKLTKVCSSIKAVRTNTNTTEGLPSSCGSQVNTNGSTEIPAVIEGGINMTTTVDESGPVENPVRKEMTKTATIKAVRTNADTKESLPSCGSRVNTNGSIEIPVVIEGDINMTTAVHESGPVENPVRKEITRMATIKAVRTNTGTKANLPSSCGNQQLISGVAGRNPTNHGRSENSVNIMASLQPRSNPCPVVLLFISVRPEFQCLSHCSAVVPSRV